MATLLGIHWAGGDWLISFPLFVLLVFIIFKNYRRVKQAVTLLVHPKHVTTIFQNFSLGKQRTKATLLAGSLVAVFLALLQPQWGKKEHIVAQEGRDLLIVLDISRSMQAKDMAPTRLDFAKLKVRNLLSKIACDRVGLVVFSGTAFLQCPLTIDHAAFLTYLDTVDTELISSGTTSLDKALGKVLDVFSSSQERKNKLVLLLTDGEDFSTNLSTMQSKALQNNITLFALGIGSPEGAPIPKLDDAGTAIGHETDDQGNIVLSTLNEKKLQELCDKLKGSYFRATYDDTDIGAIATKIKRFEKEKFTDKKLSFYEDQYPWFLALAWFCLILEWIL